MKESVGNDMGKEQQPPTYGGQALVEGVMFGGKDHTVTAIRRKDDSIDYFHLPKEKNSVAYETEKNPIRSRYSCIN